MDFAELLSYIIDNQYDGSRKKFSKSTDIPLTTVSEYVRGVKKDPPLSLLRKVKNVNTSWSLNDGKFVWKEDLPSLVSEPQASYKKTDIIDLLIAAIEESDESKRAKMIHEAIKLYGRVLEENGILREEVAQLHKDVLKLARRS